MGKKGFALNSRSLACAFFLVFFPLLSHASATAPSLVEEVQRVLEAGQRTPLHDSNSPAWQEKVRHVLEEEGQHTSLHHSNSPAWQENHHVASDSHFKAEKLENIADLAPAQGDLKSVYVTLKKTKYRPRASLGPFYQTGNSAFGLYDLFVPFTLNSKSIIFVDGRYIDRGNTMEYNVGTGFRNIIDSGKLLWTLYAFYDDRKTRFSNNFGQVTIGADFQTEKWYFNTNGYIPVGKREAFLPQFNTAFLCENNTRICYARGREKSMGGWDAEAGYDIWPGLKAYVGMYVFAAGGVKTAVGPNLRLQYDITAPHSRVLYIFDKIAIIANWRDDQLAGSVWYAGARFDITLGERPPDVGLERRMTSFIRRDLNVEMSSDGSGIGEVTESAKILRNTFDNEETQVALVSTAGDLAAAAGDARDNIIGVDGTITTAAVTNLQTNQILEGGVFSFIREGTNFSAQVGRDGTMTRGGVAGFNLIGIGTGASVGQNVTVENMNFNNAGAAGADFVIGHAASANTVGRVIVRGNTQNSAGNFLSIGLGAANVTDNASILIQGNRITNAGTVGGGIIGVTNGGPGSNLSVIVDSNVITSAVVVSNAVNLLIGQAGLNTATVTNNNIAVELTGGIGIGAVDVGAPVAGNSAYVTEITGNTIVVTGANNSALRLLGNTSVLGNIANNTMSSDPNTAEGVLLITTSGRDMVNVQGSISNNVLTVLGADVNDAGIQIGGVGAGNESVSVGGGILNNTINANGSRGIITIAGAASSTVQIFGFFGNTINNFAANEAIITNFGGVGTTNISLHNGTTGSAANLAAANGLVIVNITTNLTTDINS